MREWERERYEKRIMADEDESKPEDVNNIRKERRERLETQKKVSRELGRQ